jgi:hypothetical protein
MRRAWNVLALVLATAVGCAGDDDSGSGGTGPLAPIADMDAPCSEYDSLSDGSIDKVYRYTYDSAGFLERYTEEPGGGVGNFTYDAKHFVLRFTYNADTDAALEHEEIYTRDSAGRVLTYEQRDESGVTLTGTYTYDARGRLARSVVGRSGSLGLVTSTTDYVYTGDQLNPTSARLVYPDGATSIAYTSSADERMLHADLDDGEDGSVDRTMDITYDARRRMVSSINRTRGMVTQRYAGTYNDRGSVVMSVYANNDVSGGDDYVYTAQYSGAGMRTQAQAVSPSGEYASSIYTEVYKAACTSSTVAAHVRGTALPRLRPSQQERPVAITAP